MQHHGRWRTAFFKLAGVVALISGMVIANGQGVPDPAKVEIRANKFSDRFYTLEGQGGTIGVLIGPDGVFMVDTQFAVLSEKIAAAIRKLSPQPVRYVINTHIHPDHTGGNENFGRMGATIIAREELRRRLENPNPSPAGQPVAPMAPAGLPKLLYRDRLTLYFNGEEVRLIAVPRAHTDGDTLVWLPDEDALMTGDFFRSVQYPNIDRANGGTLQGMLDGLGLVIGLAGPATKIIPGHGATVNRMAVMAHRDMLLGVRDRVAALLAQGKSEEEVVAAKLTSEFHAVVPQLPGPGTAERFVRQVYAELESAR